MCPGNEVMHVMKNVLRTGAIVPCLGPQIMGLTIDRRQINVVAATPTWPRQPTSSPVYACASYPDPGVQNGKGLL